MERVNTKDGLKIGDTLRTVIVVKDETDSSPLYIFNTCNIYRGIRIPNSGGIFQHRPDNRIISSEFQRRRGPIQISTYDVQGSGGFVNNISNMCIPSQIRGYGNT